MQSHNLSQIIVPISAGDVKTLLTGEIDNEIYTTLKQIEIVKNEIKNSFDPPTLNLLLLQKDYLDGALSFLRTELAKRNNNFPFDLLADPK